MRSEARLVAITRLIAKLGIIIIYTTRWHDCVLSIKCHCRSADYKHSDGDSGEWVSQLQQLCWSAATNNNKLIAAPLAALPAVVCQTK